jgi:hypothetical protein
MTTETTETTTTEPVLTPQEIAAATVANLTAQIETARSAIASIDAGLAAITPAELARNEPATRIRIAKANAARATLSAEIEEAEHLRSQAQLVADAKVEG